MISHEFLIHRAETTLDKEPISAQDTEQAKKRIKTKIKSKEDAFVVIASYNLLNRAIKIKEYKKIIGYVYCENHMQNWKRLNHKQEQNSNDLRHPLKMKNSYYDHLDCVQTH